MGAKEDVQKKDPISATHSTTMLVSFPRGESAVFIILSSIWAAVGKILDVCRKSWAYFVLHTFELLDFNIE
jgi:hypothetical protein